MSLNTSLLSKFGQYKPTGVFSFEFFERNRSTMAINPTKHLFESFFLLPPEETSMEEGYRVTVNKTLDGGWVDDFGNDFKKIKISGSLYSYYFGSPATTFGMDVPILGSAARDAIGQAQEAIQSLPWIPGVSGIAALDEFFKLRYIVSRWRDKRDKVFIDKDNKLMALFPELKLLQAKSILDTITWADIGCVYHDYDDGNHYEVVFENFTAKRSKSDPFTINYNIDMIALKQFSNEIRTFGIFGFGVKESIKMVMQGLNTGFQAAIDAMLSVAYIPTAMGELFNSTVLLCQDFGNTFYKYYHEQVNDFQNLISKNKIVNDAVKKNQIEITLKMLGVNEFELANDSSNFDDDSLKIYNAIQKHITEGDKCSGLDTYRYNNTAEKYLTNDESSLDTSDISNETIDSSSNKTVETKYTYYTITENDTLQSIAYKFYGDIRNEKIIAEINNLSNKDFFNDALLGKNIKIPILNSGKETGSDNNLVYSIIKQLTNQIESQKRVLGTDLNLTSNRDFVADGTYDLGLVYGEDCYSENINDRFSFKQGTLGEIHPEWGMPFIAGMIPDDIKLMRLIDAIESQAKLDPRVQYAYVKRDMLDIQGDALKIQLVTKPITGRESMVDISELLGKLQM